MSTASNVGGFAEVFKQKVIENFEFRTLQPNLEILIATNADDLAFSIGAIAISKITGLQTELDSKIDAVVNVGSGTGLIFRDIIGQTANLKSLIGGAGITLNNNADDIEIVNDNPVFSDNIVLMSFIESSIGAGNNYGAFGGVATSTTEALRQMFLDIATTLLRMTATVNTNTSNAGMNIAFRESGGDVAGSVLVIPAATTGSFTTGVLSEIIAANNLINTRLERLGSGALNNIGITARFST